MVPALKHNSLISGSKFADANYYTILTPTEVLIYDGNDGIQISVSKEAILRGWRDITTGMWRVPLQPNVVPTKSEFVLLPSSTEEAIANVYELPSTEQIIRYLHACAGYPTKSTWIKAIRGGNYASWPFITVDNVNKHFPESNETNQGHMKGIKQGIRSTKQRKQPTVITTDAGEQVTVPLTKHHDIFVTIDEAKETMYTDQTGAFPVQSHKGNRYVMILCEIDNGIIISEPMRRRTSGEMVRAYQSLMKRLQSAGIKPKKHVLDNEISSEFKEVIKQNGIQYELVPKGQHRRNIAERGIQTWKSHTIGVLSGLPPTFPLSLWDELLPQIDMQVNLLRFSNVAPKVCAWTVLNGPHDFNRHPLAPLGVAIQMLEHTDKRKSWGVKSKPGFYIGTSLDHYRYYLGWNTETKAIRGSETVVFKHKYITNPTITPGDAIVSAARDLTKALKGNIPPPLVKSAIDHIRELTDIFDETKEKYQQRIEQQEMDSPEGAQSPRVSPVHSPRVIPAQSPRVPEVPETEPESDLIVEYPPIQRRKGTPLPNGIPRYNIISQDESTDTPARNTRSQAQIHSIMDEVMLSCVQLSTSSLRIDPRNAASRQYPMELLCEMAGAVLDDVTGDLLEYRHLAKHPRHRETWRPAFGKEIGRLAQGLPGVTDGTDTIDFIPKSEVPSDRMRDCTYARICANYRPEKADPYRVRITVGGNLINYPGDCGTPTADLLTVKLLLNSVISTKGAKFMTMDISNFYLMTPLKRKEYLKMKLDDFPEDVIAHYNLKELVTPDGYVYVAVKRGMYGLPQAGILAQELLEKRLNAHGYHQSKFTPGLWTHDWRPICFTLVVDNFGVKYVGKEHAEHLHNVISERYDVTTDWDGKRYLGLTFDWDYDRREVHLTMPDYIPDALKRFKRERPNKRQPQPHPHIPPNYGAKQQFAKEESTEPPLGKEEQKYIQQVIGTFLYYARAVDSTMLVALSAIAAEQSKPTKTTMDKVDQFLDYVASQDEAILTYRASDMVLAIHSDASYLSESKARSRAGGHFFMSSDVEYPSNNGAVLNIAQIMNSVMASAAEAEIGAMYVNAREAVPVRRTLIEMGHPQPRTPMQTDNSAAHSVVTNNVQPKRTKAMDMRFYWLRCRDAQGQFRYYWRPGSVNLADYFTKHHPASHHIQTRPVFITPKHRLDFLKQKAATAKRTVEVANALYLAYSGALTPPTRVC